MRDRLAVGPISVEDAAEVVTPARAAYVTEAKLYAAVRLPALAQSLVDLRGAMEQGLAFKAAQASERVVGAVRPRFDDDILHVGRLRIAQDQQGEGVGNALLHRVEREAPAGTANCAVLSRHLSSANLRLDERGRVPRSGRGARRGLGRDHAAPARSLPSGRSLSRDRGA